MIKDTDKVFLGVAKIDDENVFTSVKSWFIEDKPIKITEFYKFIEELSECGEIYCGIDCYNLVIRDLVSKSNLKINFIKNIERKDGVLSSDLALEYSRIMKEEFND